MNIELHKMELNDLVILDRGVSIRRVPGGWLYEYQYTNDTTAVFVPWNEEFKGRPIPDDKI